MLKKGISLFLQIKNEYYYNSFSCNLDSKVQVHNRITYAGQQFNGITGQYYLRARFYNPVSGRFTQENTCRGDGLNLYAYCGSNPVTYYEPSGFVCRTKYNAYKEGHDKGLSPKEAHDYMKEKLNIDIDDSLAFNLEQLSLGSKRKT